MGPGETLSVIALMAGIVSSVWLAARAYRQGLEVKHRELQRPAPEPVAVDRSEEFKRLEDRVRVLERIAVDRAPDLATQIEALRDTPLLAERNEA